MFNFYRRSVALVLCLLTSLVCAQNIVEQLKTRYVSGSIKTERVAQETLADIEKARTFIEARYVDESRVCAVKFFVTNCMDDVKERRHADLLSLQAPEVEANRFIRHARVEEKNKELIILQKDVASRVAQGDEDNTKREADKEKALMQKQKDEAKRSAENVLRYEKKIKQAKEHQAKILERKAAKKASEQSTPASQ